MLWLVILGAAALIACLMVFMRKRGKKKTDEIYPFF